MWDQGKTHSHLKRLPRLLRLNSSNSSSSDGSIAVVCDLYVEPYFFCIWFTTLL